MGTKYTSSSPRSSRSGCTACDKRFQAVKPRVFLTHHKNWTMTNVFSACPACLFWKVEIGQQHRRKLFAVDDRDQAVRKFPASRSKGITRHMPQQWQQWHKCMLSGTIHTVSQSQSHLNPPPLSLSLSLSLSRRSTCQDTLSRHEVSPSHQAQRGPPSLPAAEAEGLETSYS